MSGSPFDDLLGDFGDSTSTTTTTTTKTISYGNFDDDFDPFGPSSGGSQASHGRDSGLLLDFAYDSEVSSVLSARVLFVVVMGVSVSPPHLSRNTSPFLIALATHGSRFGT
ncbi:hypothetical protein BsWGS_07877 [Bradybaena similaris]